MAKGLYKVTEGKHLHTDGSWIRAGDDAIEMEAEEAAKFPNKFVLVMVPAAPAVVEDPPAKTAAAEKDPLAKK